jgi:hypothetical protein
MICDFFSQTRCEAGAESHGSLMVEDSRVALLVNLILRKLS